MDIAKIGQSLEHAMSGGIDYYERRPGIHQLIIPIFHEDGDMVDVYIEDSPKGEGHVRICDFGMALMRLSYAFQVSTPARERILDSILINNAVERSDGNLYLDAPIDHLYERILQFTGCILKVCNMRYWNRETVRSAFYDDLSHYVETEMKQFSPKRNHVPLERDPIFNVDWYLECNSRNLFMFGIGSDDKAKNVTISLLEFQKAQLPFISLIVHEDMDDLGNRARRYLTNNADLQYSTLGDFTERGIRDVVRISH